MAETQLGDKSDKRVAATSDKAGTVKSGWEAGRSGGFPQVVAASLHVAILTSKGRLFWEGLGGLDVVQEIDSPASAEFKTWRFQLRPQPFGESAHVREGVALAFARRLPGSARLAGGDVASVEGERSAPPASLP